MAAGYWFREFKNGVKNLMMHRLRSSLTMLGMVFGVSSVIAMLAVGEGASAKAMDQIRKLGSNNILINSLKPSEDESGQGDRVRMGIYGLLYADHLRIRDTIPHVERAVAVKSMRKEGQMENRTMEVRVVGTTPVWFELVKREVIAGRILNNWDLKNRNKVAVLTERGARRLLASKNSIGSAVRIDGVLFKVVGIVQSQEVDSNVVESPDRDTDAYIPLSVARNRFGDIQTRRTAGTEIREKVELNHIIVQVDNNENVEQTATAIEYMLNRFHDKKDFSINVPLVLLRQAEATKRTFNIVLGSIASISLLVGGIGIMNIMLASVTERTKEIGIRRAIGAKRRQIVQQFLIETVVLSTTGGAIGMVLGIIVPIFIERFADMPTIVTPISLIMALGISMLTGIVFGLYPAARASDLDPIIALRHE